MRLSQTIPCSNFIDFEPAENISAKFEVHDIGTQTCEEFKVSEKFNVDPTVGILCYDVTSRESFTNIKDLWFTELRELYGESFILCGLKLDLFDKTNPEHVSQREANDLRRRIGAYRSFRCSAKEYASKPHRKKSKKLSKLFSQALVLNLIKQDYIMNTWRIKEFCSCSIF